MKNPHQVIIKPVVTEKSTFAMDRENAYTFEVDSGANRIDIKGAVEDLFDVKVRKVNTLRQRGKRKRMGRNVGQTSGFKKALVTLYPGYKIDVF